VQGNRDKYNRPISMIIFLLSVLHIWLVFLIMVKKQFTSFITHCPHYVQSLISNYCWKVSNTIWISWLLWDFSTHNN